MPVLHEAALICKLAWPSWSVCNYLPTCLLVLLTCAVPRSPAASSVTRSHVTGSIANLTFISSMAVMAFVGQYGTDALAGAGLGFMWLNVSGQSIIFGTGMGLSALSSQAFGAKNYRRVALLVQRQLCYQMLLCAPIGICWWNTEKILTAFGQPPSVAYFSGQYCRHMLPGLPAIPVFNNLNAFLVSQRIPRPSMMVSLFSNLCVSVPTAFYLSQPHVLGFVGAPLGVASGQICQALLMRIVAPRVVRHPTWLPLQREALHPASWIELIRLGMGGAVGLWAEWWSNELMVFMCGIMCTQRGTAAGPCVEVAVTTLLRNFGGAAIGLSMGFAQATPVRVGNLLGAGDPASAKVAAWTGGVLQAGVCIAIGAVIVALSPIWVGWFELDEVAVALLYEVMPLAAAWWLAIAVCCGGLRNNLQGMGLVRFSAVVQLIAFYPIGTLVAWLLGFGHTPLGFLGLKGLWMGNLTGFLFMFLCLGTYFCRVDWPLQSRLAVARSSKDRAGGSQAAAVEEEGEEGEGEAESLLSRDESS